MANPFSVLAIEEEGAQKDAADFIKISSLVPDVKVKLNDSNFGQDKDKKFPSLLACSSTYGYFVAGSRTGFQLGQTKLLRETIYKAENGDAVPFDQTISVPVKEGDVNSVALTSDDLQLVVGVSGGILLTYNISDIVKNKEQSLPVQTQTLDTEIICIQPNPEVYHDVVAVITTKNEAKLIRYMTKEIITTIPNVSSMCWSKLGKQLVCGTLEGLLEAYDINGNKKDVIDPPSSKNGKLVKAVLWVENHVFLAIYADDERGHTPYVIKRKAEDPDEKYTLLDEVNPIYNEEGPQSHFYFTVIRNFGEEIKTLITLANSAAEDLAIIGESGDGSWATWIMGETCVTMPLADDEEYLDTYPVGLAVDFSASEPLAPFDSGESEAPVPPMPVLMFMTNVGQVCAYHAYSFDLAKSGTKYENMVDAQDLSTVPEPVPKAPEATPTVEAVTKGGFGEATTKIPSFSSLGSAPKPASPLNTPPLTTSTNSTPTMGFGTSGFGGGSAGVDQKVSFASLAKSSTAVPASPKTSSFELSTSSSVPTFGQPSNFGVKTDNSKPSSGSTSTTGQAPAPAFGQTSTIGQAAAPAFGRPLTFGQTPSFNQPQSFGSFGPNKEKKSPFNAQAFTTSNTETTSIDPKNPFGATSFAPASIDVDTLVKKASEEPAKRLAEEPEEDGSGAKSMFGLPSTPSKQNSNDSCTFSFESVKKDLEDNSDAGSEISKISSIDKTQDSYGFSVPAKEDTTPVKKYNAGEPVGVVDTTDSEYLHETQESDTDDDDLVVVEEEELPEFTEKLDKRTIRRNYSQNLSDADDSEESDDFGHNDNNFEEHEEHSSVNNDHSNKKADEKSSEGNVTENSLDDETSDVNVAGENKHEKEVAEEKPQENDLKSEEEKAEESKKTEEERIAEEKRLEEERVAEEKRREEEEKRREAERIAEEKRLEEERIAEEKRREEERIAEEKRREEERIAEEKRREEERIAEEKRREEERIAEEKRREEERIAEKKRREEERIAEEKRLKEEARKREEARLAALRQTPIMAHRERISQPTVHERAIGIKGIAKDFESAYFDTIEDLESTSILINDIKQDISIQTNTDFTPKQISQIMDYSFEWKLDDMYDTKDMIDKVNEATEKAENTLLELYDSVSKLLNSTNNLKLEDVRSCLERKDDLESIRSTLEDDSSEQISSLEAKSSASERALKELSDKLNELKQQINTQKTKSNDESKLTVYSLRRTIRDIERSISEQSKKISILEQEELSLRLNNSQTSNDSIATTHSQKMPNTYSINQRKSFLDQMFQNFKPLSI